MNPTRSRSGARASRGLRDSRRAHLVRPRAPREAGCRLDVRDRRRPRGVVRLVVARPEWLEHERGGDEAGRRLEARRDERAEASTGRAYTPARRQRPARTSSSSDEQLGGDRIAEETPARRQREGLLARRPTPAIARPPSTIRPSAARSTTLLEPGERQRLVEAQSEHDALLRLRSGVELLELPRRVDARAQGGHVAADRGAVPAALLLRASTPPRSRRRGSRARARWLDCGVSEGLARRPARRRGRSWPSRTSDSRPASASRRRARSTPPSPPTGARARRPRRA